MSGKEYRILTKAYGLKIIMTVSGSAGMFNIIPLMQTIGSGTGLMIFSVLLSDFLVMYFNEKKESTRKRSNEDMDCVEIKEITKFDKFNKIVTVRV